MLIDDVIVVAKAGNGGAGAQTFAHRRGSIKTPPDGGNGGNGGSIFMQGSAHVSDLSEFMYKKKIEAQNGENGKKNNQYGKNGDDMIVKLPLGTQVFDTQENLLFEVTDMVEKFSVAAGGKGGIGNKESSRPGYHGASDPEKGSVGEEVLLHLVMRLVADVGLVGLPNAGKSTLISHLTAARPKIGEYPFTTLEPNLGMLEKIVIADIPGIIEGASRGKGLGLTFLKHIEKTKMLLHLIDASEEDVAENYRKIREEFGKYSTELLNKKEVIVLTKMDLVGEEEMNQKVKILKKFNNEILTISIFDENDIQKMKEYIKKTV